MRARWDAGFSLVETIVAVAIVALIAGTAGTFFLAGATPAVASASRDVAAAFDEGRRTAIAFDAATVVFAPAVAGSGYRARVYEGEPGDAAFRPRNGPSYDSTVAISETAAPLGAPGFAFTIDSRGAVAALANYAVNGSDYVNRACPPTGSFTLQLTYVREQRVVTIPCTLGLSSAAPLALESPAAAVTAAPAAAGTCPATAGCAPALVVPAAAAACPAGLTPDPAVAGLCDASPAPATAAPGCPAGFSGTPPNCVPLLGVPSPTPAAPATPAGGCTPGAPDALGFATCLASGALLASGSAVTRNSCGTHIPVADPGPQIDAVVDVFANGAFWGSYAVTIATLKAPWIDLADGSTDCGLTYSLAFHVANVTPLTGNARTTPVQDTGDSAILDDGVAAIVDPPAGAWGTNT